MFKREENDLLPQVVDVITAGDFYDLSEGAQIIFTRKSLRRRISGPFIAYRLPRIGSAWGRLMFGLAGTAHPW